MEIIALQQYTDKYVSLYEGEIRNLEDKLANKLIAKNIVKPHGASTGNELPQITTSNNGDILTVVEGEWVSAKPTTELPSVTSSNNGNVLTVVEGTWAAAASGGGGNVVVMYTYVEGAEGFPGGFYKDDETLYTYEELVALYESGATLMAQAFAGTVVKVDVSGDGENGYEFSANVASFEFNAIYHVHINQEGYDNEISFLGLRPLVVEFNVNGSPSSLTGTDIFVPSATHMQIIGCLRQGIRVFGQHSSDSHQSGYRILQFEGVDDTSYSQIYFRDCKPVYDGSSGGHMEDLLIVVKDINGETHTESYFRQYALTAYNP